ncbi:MAG: SDR family NAD(P)-dependent oxidoreductase [Planctomycetota bacterium]|jgi:3-oxoacyl-[acyl-carrier protein] reductase
MIKKTVLTTGASRGIGKTIVEVLAQTNKYNILAPSRSELDITDQSSIDAFIKKNSNIDILINNAGVNIINNIQDTKDDDINTMFLTNLLAPLRLIGGVVPYMIRKKSGRIINISSVWGIVSKEKRSIYSATKFGLNGATKALSKELGKYNILVNSVCPGYVNTEMTKKNVTEAEKETILKSIPLNRFAEPIEIARLVKFLISDENTYITGECLMIDGGFTA